MGEVKESNKEFDKKSLKVKAELKGNSAMKQHQSRIHSIQWEDTEASEGITAKELVSADAGVISLWDLKQQTQKNVIEPKNYYSSTNEEDSLFECTVVKRDPHHK